MMSYAPALGLLGACIVLMNSAPAAMPVAGPAAVLVAAQLVLAGPVAGEPSFHDAHVLLLGTFLAGAVATIARILARVVMSEPPRINITGLVRRVGEKKKKKTHTDILGS
jgi:hypothetical protein